MELEALAGVRLRATEMGDQPPISQWALRRSLGVVVVVADTLSARIPRCVKLCTMLCCLQYLLMHYLPADLSSSL